MQALYSKDLDALSAGSYWETTAQTTVGEPVNQDAAYDVAIIGGGITGLSTALHLARDYQQRVCVLERYIPAWGASGRNGGFCCVGATRLSHDALLRQFGRDETQRFFQDQRDGVALVKQLAEQERIELEAQGQGEIQVAHQPSRWRDLTKEHQFFAEVAHYPCQLWSPEELADRAYRSPAAFGALHVGVGFGLNPMRYSLGLAEAAVRHGAQLYSHSPVISWEKAGAIHQLHTPGGTVRASVVVVATNGYTEEGMHPTFRDRLLPVLSNIITTRPLTADELAAQGWRTETPLFDTRNLLFYFRLLKDGRFLLGSRGGTSGSRAESDRCRHTMTRRLGELFPAWREVEVTHFWNGLACMSRSLTPHVGQLPDDPSVFYGLAYHGNGVAMGTWSGRTVAQMIVEKVRTDQLCAVVRQPLKRFPLAGLRVWYLRSAYVAYGLQDALP